MMVSQLHCAGESAGSSADLGRNRENIPAFLGDVACGRAGTGVTALSDER